MKPLEQKTILITGASRGIGRGCALAAAKAGANVILLGRNQKRLISVDDDIRTLTGKPASLIQFDLALTGAEAYAQLKSVIEENFSSLDAIIHCAAVFHGLAPLEVFAADKFFSTLQTNFHARYLLTYTLLPLLRRAPSADVILPLSPIADRGEAYWGAYAMAEAASRAMVEVWSEEMQSDSIRIHAVPLPFCDTPLFRKAYPFYEKPLTDPQTLADTLLNKLIS